MSVVTRKAEKSQRNKTITMLTISHTDGVVQLETRLFLLESHIITVVLTLTVLHRRRS